MHEVQFVSYDIGWNIQVADVNRSDEVLVTKATQTTGTINLHTFEEGSLVVYVLYRPFEFILCPEDYVPDLYGQRYPVKVCVRLTSATGALRWPPRLFLLYRILSEKFSRSLGGRPVHWHLRANIPPLEVGELQNALIQFGLSQGDLVQNNFTSHHDAWGQST